MEAVIFWILMILVFIYLLVTYWYVALPLAIVIGVVWYAIRCEAARREEERRKAQRADHLCDLLSEAREEFHTVPALVSAAEGHLDKAEAEFRDSAFAPFWDQIEHAANKLAQYQQRISAINNKAVAYQGEAPSLPGPLPAFDLPLDQLRDARPTASRLSVIVRRTQKNFQFATIYEQRKTNKILIDGFGTLASAIYSLRDSIESSLSDLASSLHTDLDNLSNSLTADAAARSRFEKRVVRNQERQTGMLDDIRRGHKPIL